MSEAEKTKVVIIGCGSAGLHLQVAAAIASIAILDAVDAMEDFGSKQVVITPPMPVINIRTASVPKRRKADWKLKPYERTYG